MIEFVPLDLFHSCRYEWQGKIEEDNEVLLVRVLTLWILTFLVLVDSVTGSTTTDVMCNDSIKP